MFSVVLGHWLVRPIGLYYLYPLAVLHGSLLGEDLPNPKVCCLQLLGCMLVDDTWFYWMHRGLHHFPWLYRTVHKKHHRFTRPNIFATEFAHPVEDLVVNMAGTVLGPILLGVHPLLLVGYMGMKFYQSLEAHSGYNIPFPFSLTSVIDSMDCAPAHDFHHSHNVGNFGGWFMFWDW
ncbi:hypothetical protein BASA82_000261 [Batrachochytrium salamandrivorans]|nr:hypothetical protein BASA82_000261 [Batrachochytrium salamandrivorans]